MLYARMQQCLLLVSALSLPKPSASAKYYNLTFGPSLAQSDWHDVGYPSSCNASQFLPVLVFIIILILILRTMFMVLSS